MRAAAALGCGRPARLSRIEREGQSDFAPRYALWSDGAEKRRFLQLPPGTRIDTSDMDRWQLPVGARLWKEFRKEGLLVETRLIERTGPGAMDYFMGSFVWDDSDAVFAPAAARDIRGTDHDAPSAERCWSCHAREPGRALGLSAVQLPAETIAELTARGAFTDPPPGEHRLVGDPDVVAAFGYLHANCGHCHADEGRAGPDSDQILRLSSGERDAA